MPQAPPSFGSRSYWERRFTENPNPFEWLESPTILDAYIIAALRDCEEKSPELLHIGCGTSLLSFHLRSHVEEPVQVHNVDYSTVAVRIGKEREVEIFDAEAKGESGEQKVSMHSLTEVEEANSRGSGSSSNNDPKAWMRWSTLDLLDLRSVVSNCTPSSYAIIIDKSTADSISCAEDIAIEYPFPLFTPQSAISTPPPPRLDEPLEPIHPLHILAIHVAFLTKPGGRWLSLSYSEDRFPFLRLPNQRSDYEDIELLPQEHVDQGLPDPGKLWRLERKEGVQINETTHEGTTYRPSIRHWAYVLVRTEVELAARACWAESLGFKK